MILRVFLSFFFSSRRRHTRSLCDWSSDVCSSDLEHRKAVLMVRQTLDADSAYADVALHANGLTSLQYREEKGAATHEIQANEIGRASCREECRYGWSTNY